MGVIDPFHSSHLRLETVGLLHLFTIILIKVLFHAASLEPHCKKEVRFSEFIRFYELHLYVSEHLHNRHSIPRLYMGLLMCTMMEMPMNNF